MIGAGLNELADIIQSPSMDESSRTDTAPLESSSVTNMVARSDESREVKNEKEEGLSRREVWEKGDSALERVRDEAEESFGVFALDNQVRFCLDYLVLLKISSFLAE